MYFIKFPVAGTNIFPIANSDAGGQLLSEYNIRARESVGTASNVNYFIGPSYVHGPNDFDVRLQTDGAGNPISSTILEITAGRGVINGHYVESLVNINIDMIEANVLAKSEGLPPLKGQLAIGLKAMYSTEPTIAGSLMVENRDNLYEGIQVVILPVEEFVTPADSPDDESKVTAHIKLAEFVYRDGSISPGSIIQNYPQRCQSVEAERIGNIDNLLSDAYVRKAGLDPKKLYVFAGKGTDPATGKDTWCDATDSLMVWDKAPVTQDTDPEIHSAQFGINVTDGSTVLYVPHKQVDQNTTTSGDLLYYKPVTLKLPLADYNSETSGTINSNYTKNIKRIRQLINDIYQIPGGKMRYFLESIDDRSQLPPINSAWSIGDYIVVRQDKTVTSDITSDLNGIQYPTTAYVIIPNLVQKVEFKESRSDDKLPEGLTGIQLGENVLDASNGDSLPNTADSDTYNAFWGLPSTVIRGQVGVDYFVCKYIALPEEDNDPVITKYYYAVSQVNGANEYSAPVYISGGMSFASTELIGGFLNVPETYQDAGYVYLDSDGHLRVLDYALLRSGTLAYQLGQDYTIGSGLTNSEIQAQLDEYVNDRILFPNADHVATADNPNVITLTLDLSQVSEDSEDTSEINIRNIDSRFGTSLLIKILGKSDNRTTINISNCQKIRISNNISGTPIINLYRTGLYYDANIIDYIHECQRSSDYPIGFTGISDLSIWYERYSADEPSLVVNGMTVTETDAPVIPEEINYWSPQVVNDNHFMYALQSVTLGSDGSIIGCRLYMKNETSANNALGTSVIISDFTLPQGGGLQYPVTGLTKSIKVTGSFVTAYPSQSPVGYIVIDTNFTATTGIYDPYANDNTGHGQIACFSNTYLVQNIGGIDVESNGDYPNIDSWRDGSFHSFIGSVIG